MLKVNCKKYIDRYIAREREVLQKKKSFPYFSNIVHRLQTIKPLLFSSIFKDCNHNCTAFATQSIVTALLFTYSIVIKCYLIPKNSIIVLVHLIYISESSVKM